MGTESTNPRRPMFLVLSDDLITGSAEIDRQHQRLLDTANAIVMATGPEAEARVPEALGFLMAYLRHHQEAEEAVMAALAYPWLELHQRAHGCILERLESLTQGLGSGVRLRTTQVGLHFAMQEWSSHHVQVVDQRLARWLAKRRGRLGADLEEALWGAGRQAEAILGSLGGPTRARARAQEQNAAK